MTKLYKNDRMMKNKKMRKNWNKPYNDEISNLNIMLLPCNLYNIKKTMS